MSSMASWPLREDFLDAGEPATSFPPVLNRLAQQANRSHTVIVDVRDYGTTGDGVADDTAEILSGVDDIANGLGPANTQGFALDLGSGIYKVSSAILTKNRVSLISQSPRGAIIKAASGFLSNVDVADNTTTLTAGIDASQTSITVASASAFPPHGTFKIKIDSEILHVTAGNGTTTWTVIRGRDGTSGATHSNAATVKEVVSRVVELGDGVSTTGNFAFNSLLKNITVDVNGEALTTAVFSQQANEGSGVDSCLISGYRQYGIYWAPGASILRARDSEVYAGTGGATYGVYSRAWGQNTVHNVTSIGNPTTKHAASFCVVASHTSLAGCHAEECTDGAYMGSNAVSDVRDLVGHSSVTNLLHISGNTEWVTAALLEANSATNILVDDLAGLTITSANEGILRQYNQRSTRIGPTIIRIVSGSPEGVLAAAPGSLALDTTGGAGSTLFVKESGTGSTGWIAK
jgi:hypothetical protein